MFKQDMIAISKPKKICLTCKHELDCDFHKEYLDQMILACDEYETGD